MIGQTISHYKILEKLGEGGMGVVYKAHDTKLDRTIALKFLPHHLMANEAEQARFLQEAKAAAQINHPNVCSIIDIQELNGEQFIVMEYVDGQTLRTKVQGSGLKVEEAIAYALQIGEALQEAHNKGIVHRDIKCENIMVNSRNQIKVMDFGLAKLKGSLKLTRTSSTVGTLAYMAPEQIQGSEVDHRSDIFSFGVVLFEMLTGHMPFRGEHEASMMYSIMNEEPETVTKFRPELSSEFIHIFNRALEKNPADRYQSMNDLMIDLRRIKRESTKVSRASLSAMPVPQEFIKSPSADRNFSTEHSVPSDTHRSPKTKLYVIAGLVVLAAIAAYLFYPRDNKFASSEAVSKKKMIAVLPFENMGSPEQESFADGMTEEITSRLSGLSGLGVIARTSAMQYKKTTKSLHDIGAELGIEYVLQGTIRWGTPQDGSVRVRINPALVRVSDATQIWSQPYDAVFSDVFKLQSDISTQVATALGVTLLQPERQLLEEKVTDNSEAYEFYLRGTEYFRRTYQEKDFRIAIDMFQKAINLDPNFSRAYARLSETHSAMYWFFYDHTEDRLSKAKESVDKALQLEPNSPDAHLSLGMYYYWGYLDYENALKEFSLAEKIKPNDPRIILGIASVQRRQGKMQLAAENMAKAFQLDPRSSENAYNAAQTYTLIRNYPEAEAMINKSLFITPDAPSRYSYKAFLYLLWGGSVTKADKVLQEMSSVGGTEAKDQEALWTRATVKIFSGQYDQALNVVQSSPEFIADAQFRSVPRVQMFAQIYGLKKQQTLERAYYDSARILMEQKVKEQPEDSRFHSALGIAYAGLGRKQQAILEGKKGVDLMPLSKEAWRGTYRLWDLAYIYILTGEYDSAIDTFDKLLSIPSEVSAALLRIDPACAPLRDLPRFQKLVGEKK